MLDFETSPQTVRPFSLNLSKFSCLSLTLYSTLCSCHFYMAPKLSLYTLKFNSIFATYEPPSVTFLSQTVHNIERQRRLKLESPTYLLVLLSLPTSEDFLRLYFSWTTSSPSTSALYGTILSISVQILLHSGNPAINTESGSKHMFKIRFALGFLVFQSSSQLPFFS